MTRYAALALGFLGALLVGCGSSRAASDSVPAVAVEPVGASATGESSAVSVDPATFAGMSWPQAMKSCLESFGWTVSVDDDGGVDARYVPVPAQQAQRAAEHEACAAAAPSQPEPSRSEFERMYALRIDQYQCLVAEGFAAAEPSSIDEFVASGGAWSPLKGLAPDLGVAALGVCPEPT